MPQYSQRELILARLATARRELEEVLSHIGDDLLAWAPAEGMRTVSGQLVEIAGTEIQLLAKLRHEPDISWEEAQVRVGDASTVKSLEQGLNQVRDSTLAYIISLSDEDLDQPADLPPHWHEAIGLTGTPVGEVLRGIAQHEAYHTGQLVSYLWARGDNPYKW